MVVNYGYINIIKQLIRLSTVGPSTCQMDHQRNSRNIKSTGGNIRGNQHTCSIPSKKFWRNLCTPSASPVNDLPETKDSTRRLQEIPKLPSSTCVLRHVANFSLILCLSVLFLGFR